MQFSAKARSAAGIVASLVLVAAATMPCAGDVRAEPPKKPVARAAPPPPHPAAPHVFAPRVVTPHVVTPHVTPQVNVNVGVSKSLRFTPNTPPSNNPAVTHQQLELNRFHHGPGSTPGNPAAQPFGNPAAQNFNPKLGLQGANQLKLGPGKPVFAAGGLKPGPGGFQQVKPAFPVVSSNNRFWPIHKGPRFLWVGGFKKFFVPVGALGVVLIGGSYWYPDGYVSIAGPACAGFTPDGCQLHWRMVDFADGGAEPQCVQYCPQVGPPPAQLASLPPPPPLPSNGACQLTIFSDPNFAGLSAPTVDNQPSLSQTGWRNEIGSIQVQSGTWDFFTDENFGGDSMRLPAGTYPMLAPEWTKKIGSFMCVQPTPPGA